MPPIMTRGNGSVTEANNCAVGTVAKKKQVDCKSDFTNNNEFGKKETTATAVKTQPDPRNALNV